MRAGLGSWRFGWDAMHYPWGTLSAYETCRAENRKICKRNALRSFASEIYQKSAT